MSDDGYVQLTTPQGVIYVRPTEVAVIGREVTLRGEPTYRTCATRGGFIFDILDDPENMQKLRLFGSAR